MTSPVVDDAGDASAKTSGDRRTMFRAIRSGYVTQLLSAAMTFVAAVCQARLLGPAGRGEVVRFSNSAGLLTLYLGFGIGSTITYFASSQRISARRLIRMLGLAIAPLTLAVGASVAALGPLRLSHLAYPSAFSLREATASLTGYFVIVSVGTWVGAWLAARRDFLRMQVVNVAMSVGSAAVSFALLLLHPRWISPAVIVALMIGVELVRTSGLAFLLKRESVHQSDDVPATNTTTVRDLFGYSALSYAGDVVQFMTYRLDMWIVDGSRGSAELGSYSLAVSLAQLVWILPAAVGTVLFPYLPRLDTRSGAELTLRVAKLVGISCAVLAMFGYAMSIAAVPRLFGTGFRDVAGLIGILAVGIVPSAVGKILANYIASAGSDGVRWNLVAAVGTCALSIPLYVVLIPPLGAWGAAGASAVTYSVQTLILLLVFKAKSGLAWSAIVALPRGAVRDLRRIARGDP